MLLVYVAAYVLRLEVVTMSEIVRDSRSMTYDRVTFTPELPCSGMDQLPFPITNYTRNFRHFDQLSQRAPLREFTKSFAKTLYPFNDRRTRNYSSCHTVVNTLSATMVIDHRVPNLLQ